MTPAEAKNRLVAAIARAQSQTADPGGDPSRLTLGELEWLRVLFDRAAGASLTATEHRFFDAIQWKIVAPAPHIQALTAEIIELEKQVQRPLPRHHYDAGPEHVGVPLCEDQSAPPTAEEKAEYASLSARLPNKPGFEDFTTDERQRLGDLWRRVKDTRALHSWEVFQ